MSIILNVDEKILNVISLLPDDYSEEEFLELFKKEYPKDYIKCMVKFRKEEQKTKPGKHHPMQHPDHHIKCALRSFLSRKNINKNEPYETNQ